MTFDQIAEWDQESLAETEHHLHSMMVRLREILAMPAITSETFAEIAAIFNNVAYIFLYLESNEAHVRYDELLRWRAAFFDDADLTDTLACSIEGFHSDDPDVETSRRDYLATLRRPAQQDDLTTARAAELQAAAKAVLHDVRTDQAAFLRKLGADPGNGNPVAVFYGLSSRTGSATVRAKLGLMWEKVRDRRRRDLVALIDQQVGLRRASSADGGHRSVLARTLEMCRVTESDAVRYTDICLRGALESHRLLEEEIRNSIGVADRPVDHFGHYVRGLTGGRRAPLFHVDRCLAFLTEVGRTAFGLEFVELPRRSSHVIAYAVAEDGREVGAVNFDLWQSGARPANRTTGIRNRLECAGVVQRPVAYVSCRFEDAGGESGLITFQNVHSLFHEFGHAINHLLITKRLPNQSGLEYLPLERLENLSMWFEKWVYHPDLAEAFALDAAARDGLALCQQVKGLEYRRTHLERAVTAALDLDVHRHPTAGLAEVYAEIEERYELAGHCCLGDFLGSFTWPMFQAHPGANFAYLWGAADSAERFLPVMATSVAAVGPPSEVRWQFRSCFDFDEPSDEPDPTAVYRFYDEVVPATAPTWGAA
ncbi:MAG: M3 family metallopeptidase [Chloroflexi bacterium]|nr:M3 family metallopeptidase [Chloroflexota bacterium]